MFVLPSKLIKLSICSWKSGSSDISNSDRAKKYFPSSLYPFFVPLMSICKPPSKGTASSRGFHASFSLSKNVRNTVKSRCFSMLGSFNPPSIQPDGFFTSLSVPSNSISISIFFFIFFYHLLHNVRQ